MAEDGTIAGRLRRPTWRDPRLLVGLVLICGAVVAVAMALRAADTTRPYYAAATPLSPGTTLGPDDLTIARARVDDGVYLAADGEAPWGLTVSRAVGVGELVPTVAVDDPASFDGRVVGVVAHAPVSPDVVAGSTVDVWVGSQEAGSGEGSALVAAGLMVAEVARAEGAFAVGGGETVYLSVPSAEVAGLLDAISQAQVTIVGRGSP